MTGRNKTPYADSVRVITMVKILLTNNTCNVIDNDNNDEQIGADSNSYTMGITLSCLLN